MEYFIQSTGELLNLERRPFASGGEGALFKILKSEPWQQYVAKIFHKNKLDAQKQQKITYLYNNPPVLDSPFVQQELPVIWVEELIVDKTGKVVGFLMPFAEGEKLEILCAPKLPKRLSPQWYRFGAKTDDAYKLRLKVCYNVATALRQIHASGRYVLVDLKPDNIVIKSNGMVSIVDTDSLEVVENNSSLYAATVATPEYTPPEYYQGVKPGEHVIENSWDRFSMAVIFYKILLGIHPYAATSKPPYHNNNSLGDKIKHGLFVHSPELKSSFEVIPPPHQQFHKLDPAIQQLFIRAFADGHHQPELRPTAEEWCSAIRDNPLLLTNRSIPSREKHSIFDSAYWFDTVLDTVLNKNQLISKQTLSNTINRLETDKKELLVHSYQQVFEGIKKLLGLYLKVTLPILFLCFIISLLAGNFFIIDAISLFYTQPLNLFFQNIGICLLVGLVFLPAFMAIFAQSKNASKYNFSRKIAAFLEMPLASRINKLKKLQSDLYSKRVALKESLREMKNEIAVWSKIKLKREKTYKSKHKKGIADTSSRLKIEINEYHKEGLQHDERMRDLIKEEATALKELRKTQLDYLETHAVYRTIAGKTAEQKIAYLDNKNVFSEQDSRQHKAALNQLIKEHQRSKETIKDTYDLKHQQIEAQQNAHKIKVADLLKSSDFTQKMERSMEKELLDKSYRKLLINIKDLEQKIVEKERSLQAVNATLQDIKTKLDQN